jgi:hypothetical protein
MFRQKEWSFTGSSGTTYIFSIHPKSDGLPRSAGVYIQAYTRPRGHMAGWRVNPLRIGQAEDIASAVDHAGEPSTSRCTVWNSNLILLESSPSARDKCVRDLDMQGVDYMGIGID